MWVESSSSYSAPKKGSSKVQIRSTYNWIRRDGRETSLFHKFEFWKLQNGQSKFESAWEEHRSSGVKEIRTAELPLSFAHSQQATTETSQSGTIRPEPSLQQTLRYTMIPGWIQNPSFGAKEHRENFLKAYNLILSNFSFTYETWLRLRFIAFKRTCQSLTFYKIVLHFF